MFYRQLLIINSLILLFLISPKWVVAQRTQLCNDNRQFYTQLLGGDTSVFLTQQLFNLGSHLYGMSAADSFGNEIDCNVAEFRFILMRKNEILISFKFDTMSRFTLDTLRGYIKNVNLTQGDILIFTEIKLKHYFYANNTYCYHDGLPMLKVIDNFKTYPRRMYMDPNKDIYRLDKPKKIK